MSLWEASARHLAPIPRASSARLGVQFLLTTALSYLLLWARAPRQLVMFPDSKEYIQFGKWAAAGYPLFLRWVGLGHLMMVQMALYALSIAILACFVSWRSKAWVGALVAMVILANPESSSFPYAVMSESLYLVLLNLFLAVCLVYPKRQTLGLSVLVGMLCGIAVCTRPISYLMVAGFVVTWMMAPRTHAMRNWHHPVAALACLALIVATERSYTRHAHNGEIRSLAGPHLFAKAGLLNVTTELVPDPSMTPLETRLTQMLVDDFAPVRRVLLQSESSAAYPVLESFYETCFEHSCMDALRQSADVSGAELDSTMLRIAKARVLRAPLQFFGLALREYKALWFLYPRSHPSLAPRVDRFIADARPLPFEAQLPPDLLAPATPVRQAYIVRPALIVIALITHAVLLAYVTLRWLRRKSVPEFSNAAAVVGAVVVVAVFVFNALFGVGGSRYSMGMWPAIALMLVAIVFELYGYALVAIRKRWPTSDTNTRNI